MVFQHQVYSTGNCSSSRAGSASSVRREVFIPRSQKEYLEQHILKKREAEVKRAAYWSETSDYYSKVAQQSERYNGLTSQEARRASLEASTKEREREKRKEGLLGRRNKLKVLYAKEKEMYQEELEKLPSGVKPIHDMRSEREKMRKEREEVMKKEAEIKMLQHWKINNPKFREAESSRGNIMVRKQLEQQMAEKRESEEQKRKEQEDMDRLMMEEDIRKRNELLKKEEERKAKLDNLKKDLEMQMRELREREREMEVWRRARAEQEELQRRVEQCEEERKRVDLTRANREIETYQKRQHRLKLKMKTKQIQEDLEADKRKLQEMEAITRLQDDVQEEKKRKAVEEVEWMRNVLEQQQEEEKKREKELELMFAEEAAKMWAKQEEVWEREVKARKRLMDEVSSGWKKQHEERLTAARLVEEGEMKRMAEIRDDVKQLSQYLQEQDKSKEERRERLVEALDGQVREGEQRRMRQYQEVVEEDMRRRQEEIREENKLARNLAGWSLEPKDAASSADFRRRKVRWYY